MKPPIERILPIILCIVLPILNAVTTRGIVQIDEINGLLLIRWFAISLMLYILWHLLAFFTKKGEKHRWIWPTLAIVVFLIIVYNVFLLTPVFKNKDMKWMFIFKYFLAVMPFLIIQYAFRAYKKVAQLELEKQQMQTENYKVQLESLRTKVDPHFLFNALNTLRTMVRHKDVRSEQFILSLSDFYRQTLKYNETTLIGLTDEINVLESYLFLMKNRNEDAVQIEIEIEKSHLEHQIPTLALQTVVENCFKHNMMTSKLPLSIKIISTDNYTIEVSNNIQPKLNPGSGSGYGLDSLKKRYELLGIENGIEIKQTETAFTIYLKLI
jgi:sensor histidine kinase YesM